MKIKHSLMIIIFAAILAIAGCKKTDSQSQVAGSAEPADESTAAASNTPVAESTVAHIDEPTAENTPQANDEQVLVSYLMDKQSIDEVCSAITSAGLNADGFRAAVEKYSSINGMSDILPPGWILQSDMKTDFTDCADAWESATEDNDGNCRLTALLLLGDKLKYSKLRSEYNGTYMMFDLDSIENSTNYADIDPMLLSSLFGEWELEGDLESTFKKSWTDSGFSISSDKVSLISIVFSAVSDNCAFVGHTGTLIKTDDGLMFIEKIAFEKPYVVTKAKSLDSIVEMLAARDDYSTTDEELKSVIFENDKLIGTIG